MGYFLKELFHDSKFFWISRIIIGIWFVAGVDFITSTWKPPGLFNYLWFYITLALTILGFIAYAVYLGYSGRQKKEQEQLEEVQASLLEPRLEQEMRRKAAQHPEFATHCYQCRHFNHEVMQCGRKMRDERVKEIRINNVTYCLYWEESNPPPG